MNGNQQIQRLLREMRPDDTDLLLQVQVHMISVLPSWRCVTKITCEQKGLTAQRTCTGKAVVFGPTSGYLDLQGGADEGHEGGGEVDGHVVVHGHVHQDESLMAAEKVSDTTKHTVTQQTTKVPFCLN